MKTTLYYFSATGNNLSIAKKLQENLAHTELVSITKEKDKSTTIKGENVGFIFPVYAWGIPLIVKEFIMNANFKNVKYIFAISGCAGTAGNTMVETKKLLKSKKQQLAAAYILEEPSNGISVDTSGLMHKFMQSNRGNRINESIDVRIDEIVDAIKNKTNIQPEKDAFIVNQTSNIINTLALKVFKTQDKLFWTNDDCIACGICVKICPRDNITLKDNKPQWHHNCENCTACINWCPKVAIESGELTKGKNRYQKEGIRLEELL